MSKCTQAEKTVKPTTLIPQHLVGTTPGPYQPLLQTHIVSSEHKRISATVKASTFIPRQQNPKSHKESSQLLQINSNNLPSHDQAKGDYDRQVMNTKALLGRIPCSYWMQK